MRMTGGVAVIGLLLSLAACGDGAESSPAETGESRTIEHARGTAEVTVQPSRVVTLEPLELDTAVALGVTPVGAALALNATELPAYLGVSDVASVGTVDEPDLEAIAALEPDLIFGTEARHSELFDELDAIAPTVYIGTQADPWRENAELIGDALGRKPATEQLLNGVDERCGQIKEDYAVEGKTGQMIRPQDETTLTLYGPTSFAGSLLECVGYTIPEQKWEDGFQVDISPENAVDARADDVFVTAVDVNDATAVPGATARNTDAFPSVTLVDTSYWVSGVGPKGAGEVLDDIEEHLQAAQ